MASPAFKKGAEVHYYRQNTDVWVYATVCNIVEESKGTFYELKYESWDETHGCVKTKHMVSEKVLLSMQEDYILLQQSSQSISSSIQMPERPRWLREDTKGVQVGDKVWFIRRNGHAVVAEVSNIHYEHGNVDLTYWGLVDGEDDVPQQMRKKGVTFQELAIAQHPRNFQPRSLGTLRDEEQQTTRPAKKQKSILQQIQLQAASRVGDIELCKRLLQHRVDPTICNEKDGSSALHIAAFHGQSSVLNLLLQDLCLDSMGAHRNWKGETPLDVARERLHFCPSDRTFKVFRCLFGRDPDAQEKASLMRDAIPEKAGEFRTFNQGFVEAVAVCPLIGDRSAPFDTD